MTPRRKCSCETCPTCRAREAARQRYRTDPQHRARQKARVKVGDLVRGKRLQVPEVCSICGQPGDPDSRGARGIHGHHAHGYSGRSATVVTWLCRRCHAAVERDVRTIHPDQMRLINALPPAPAGDEPTSDSAGPSDLQEVTP